MFTKSITKNIFSFSLLIIALFGFTALPSTAQAQSLGDIPMIIIIPGNGFGNQSSFNTNPYFNNDDSYLYNETYYPSNPYQSYQQGGYYFNDVSGGSSYSYNNDDEPRARTNSIDNVDDESAELNGEVDMNDFNNGIVFFVYGQDENKIEDVEDDYDSYDDVRDDEEDDDFEVVRVDNDLDGQDNYSEDVDNLEEDERYYVIICVEYEDEDDDETLECGQLREFETDAENYEEPDVSTDNAQEIEDHSAELNGEIDMNDFQNGLAFFVYGEDEGDVEDVEDEDEYQDINEQGDDLQKIIADSDVDANQNISRNIYGLDANTDIYFRLCVQYEDEDDDQTLECGNVEHFETD